MPPRLTVEFELLDGWGVQIGWLNAAIHEVISGLGLNRFPVFRDDTGAIDIGLPTTPGAHSASRHSAVTFDIDRHHQRFIGRLRTALRVAHPELFDRGPRP